MEPKLTEETLILLEWNSSFEDIVFPSVRDFIEALDKLGVTAEQLEFDPASGRSKGINAACSVWSSDGSVQLTGYGVLLLYQATGGDFDRVTANLGQYRKADNIALLEEWRVRVSLYSLTRELDTARAVREYFPTSTLQQFVAHFQDLLSQLRDGIPYSDRDSGEDIAPGKLLELYLISFVVDPQAVKGYANAVANGTLSLLESARCITDETRTKKFLSAVRDAVQGLQTSPIKTIDVIDAGCGAIPIQAIQAAITDPRVRVTAIELNQASAEMARQIVKAIGLNDQIKIVRTDASTYRPTTKAHIIVSETLQAGLGGEPVVQILNNLKPYLAEGGRMIPESVDIKCGLLPLSDIREAERGIKTGIGEVPVTDPSWEQRIFYKFGDPIENISFNLSPQAEVTGPNIVMVGIDVHLGNETLVHNESLITMPRGVLDGKQLEQKAPLIIDDPSQQACISYQPGDTPIGLLFDDQTGRCIE